MHPVEQYLRSMGEIRRTGAAVPETSYYGALETLLNEIGDNLSPRVRAVLTLRDEGARLPDGGPGVRGELRAPRDKRGRIAHVIARASGMAGLAAAVRNTATKAGHAHGGLQATWR